MVYNVSNPPGQQILSIDVRCQNCTIPVYEPLDLEKYYSIAIPTYLSSGGDGFEMLTNVENLIIGPMDLEVLEYYIEHRDPVFIEEEGRIIVYGEFINPS